MGLSNNHLDQNKYIFTYSSLLNDPFAQNSLQNLPAKKLVLSFSNLDLSHFGLTDITAISQLCVYDPFEFHTRSWKMITEIYNLKINLAHNILSILPEDIGNLVNMRSLNLRSNTLMSVPESIGCLSNLESIDVSNNDLQSLPQGIHRLSFS